VAALGFASANIYMAVRTAQPLPRRGLPVDTGTVYGRALFEGTVPSAPPLSTQAIANADPWCGRLVGEAVSSAPLLVSEGSGLENVFVYVKQGLENLKRPPPAAPVRVDQQGCQYSPHVIGLQTGQQLEVVNSDPTLHNVKALAAINAAFNLGQPRPMRSTRIFEKAEVMIRLGCDVHPWMAGYVGVVDHPFFTVTGRGGNFMISGLPFGDYALEAWHERLGSAIQKVRLGPDAATEISFVFKGVS